jgi:single-strand DNA-binding protein
MAGDAQIYLRGNLGAEPELKVLPSGITVCNFSVGCTPRIKKDEQWMDGETTWYRVALWGRDAESAIDALHKGTLVDISGEVSNRKYVDKEGIEKTSLEVNAKKYAIVPLFATASRAGTTTTTDPWSN